jgi:hypothetical protein
MIFALLIKFRISMKKFHKITRVTLSVFALGSLAACFGGVDKISFTQTQDVVTFDAVATQVPLEVDLKIMANTDSGAVESSAWASTINNGIQNLFTALNYNYNVNINIQSILSNAVSPSSLQGYTTAANCPAYSDNASFLSSVGLTVPTAASYKSCLYQSAPQGSDVMFNLSGTVLPGVDSSAQLNALASNFATYFGAATPIESIGDVANRRDSESACRFLKLIGSPKSISSAATDSDFPLVKQTNGRPQVYVYISPYDLISSNLAACSKLSQQAYQNVTTAWPPAIPGNNGCTVNKSAVVATYPALSNLYAPRYDVSYTKRTRAKLTLNYVYTEQLNVAGDPTPPITTESVVCYYDDNKNLVVNSSNEGAGCLAFGAPSTLGASVSLDSATGLTSAFATTYGITNNTPCPAAFKTFIYNTAGTKRPVLSCAIKSSSGVVSAKRTVTGPTTVAVLGVAKSSPITLPVNLSCSSTYERTLSASGLIYPFYSTVPGVTAVVPGNTASGSIVYDCNSVTGTVLNNITMPPKQMTRSCNIIYTPLLDTPVIASCTTTQITINGSGSGVERTNNTAVANPYDSGNFLTAIYKEMGTLNGPPTQITQTFPAWTDSGACSGIVNPSPPATTVTAQPVGTPVQTTYWSEPSTGANSAGTVFGKSLKSLIESGNPSDYQVSIVSPDNCPINGRIVSSPRYTNAVTALNAGKPGTAAKYNMCDPSSFASAVSSISSFIGTQYQTAYVIPSTAWYAGNILGLVRLRKNGVWLDYTSSANITANSSGQLMLNIVAPPNTLVGVDKIELTAALVNGGYI